MYAVVCAIINCVSYVYFNKNLKEVILMFMICVICVECAELCILCTAFDTMDLTS